MDKSTISLIIPSKNEAKNLPRLIHEIQETLENRYDYEIIVVDDGSTDGSVQKLKEIRHTGCHRLRIFKHEKSLGQTTALISGIKAARGEWIVTLDGDGQNDPSDIPLLLSYLLDPFKDDRLHLVVGHRKRRSDSFVTRLSSRIANTVRRRLLKDQTPDTGCGLKVFSRDAFFALPYFDHMHRFLPALFQRQGGKMISVEVKHRSRKHGQSNYGVFDRLWIGIVDLIGVLWLQRRTKIPGELKEL